jgi:hypothetical protein
MSTTQQLRPNTIAIKLSYMGRTIGDVQPSTAVGYLGVKTYENKSLAIDMIFKMLREAKELATKTENWKTSQVRADFYLKWANEFAPLTDGSLLTK